MGWGWGGGVETWGRGLGAGTATATHPISRRRGNVRAARAFDHEFDHQSALRRVLPVRLGPAGVARSHHTQTLERERCVLPRRRAPPSSPPPSPSPSPSDSRHAAAAEACVWNRRPVSPFGHARSRQTRTLERRARLPPGCLRNRRPLGHARSTLERPPREPPEPTLAPPGGPPDRFDHECDHQILHPVGWGGGPAGGGAPGPRTSHPRFACPSRARLLCLEVHRLFPVFGVRGGGRRRRQAATRRARAAAAGHWSHSM